MIKRNVSLLLAVLLLLSSAISFSEYSGQNWNWREWSQRFFKIDKETAEKFMPFAIFSLGLLTAGSLYYWMKKKGQDTTSQPTKPTTITDSATVSVPKTSIILQQFKVYSQFNHDGGGGASCGYHSLLRSMQVVNALGTDQNMSKLQEDLMNSKIIQTYFGENGIWRKDIIAKRKQEEFKKELHIKLVTGLRKNTQQESLYNQFRIQMNFKDYDDFNSKVINLYKSSLGFIENWIVRILSEPEMSTLSYDFTNDGIRGYISKGLLNLRNKENENLVAELQEDKTIDVYFDYDEIRKNVLSENWVVKLRNLWNEILANPQFASDFRGEWLSDGEVEHIWEYHKKDILEENIFPENVCKFKAIANFDSIGMEDFDEVTPYIKENIKPDLNQKKQLFGVFALGTMRQIGETQGTRGHWYSLVMHQDWDGNRKYYVMDSANNTDRTQDKNALKIIDLIEH